VNLAEYKRRNGRESTIDLVVLTFVGKRHWRGCHGEVVAHGLVAAHTGGEAELDGHAFGSGVAGEGTEAFRDMPPSFGAHMVVRSRF